MGIRIDLNQRQKLILRVLRSTASLSAGEILDQLITTGEDISRPTLNRELEKLTEVSLIEKQGAGPGIKYNLSAQAKLITYIEPNNYFEQDPDSRKALTSFNWQVFDLLNDFAIFTSAELRELDQLNNLYRKSRKKLSTTLVRKEIERITIEFSWKSSKIEGNTYTLLETENLLKNGVAAANRSPEETQMIVNHKDALKYIFAEPEQFKQITKGQIESIHTMLTKGLDITGGIRNNLVGITGTTYKPLDNRQQIEEALVRVCELISRKESPFEKSLLAMLLLSYIQAFEDGNKRTSRLIGNALLLAYNCCPLSLRSVDEVQYKQGLILFYEQNNLSLFKETYLEQARFAVENYFQAWEMRLRR